MTTKTENACRLLARIPNNRQGRAALKCLRDSWNREGWRLRVLFSGPRKGWATPKADAHTFRVYADRLTQNNTQEWTWARERNREIGVLQAQVVHWRDLSAQQALDLGTASKRAAQWEQAGRDSQRQLNSIPKWVLYLVGVWHEARAILNDYRRA